METTESTIESLIAKAFPMAQEPQLNEEPLMAKEPTTEREPSVAQSQSVHLTQSPYYNFLREYWVGCDKDGTTPHAIVSGAVNAWRALEAHERDLFEETNYLRARFGHMGNSLSAMGKVVDALVGQPPGQDTITPRRGQKKKKQVAQKIKLVTPANRSQRKRDKAGITLHKL